jgi:hypothetical protein
MLWVERAGDRRSQAILAQNFSLENGDRQKKEKAKEQNRDAHSRVQSSDERAGRGSVCRPFPPRPPSLLMLCHCDIVLDAGHERQKGDTSN